MLGRFSCLVLVFWFSSSAMATNFWLSTSGDVGTGSAPPPNASAVESVDHSVGTTTGSIFVWARPDQDETLINWTLRLRSTDPSILTFTNAFVEDNFNPELNEGVVRWEFVKEPAGDVSSIDEFQGFNIFQVDRLGIGIGSASDGVPDLPGNDPDMYDDPLFDEVNNAWLLAQIDYTLSSVIGQTELFLQIGENGINNLGQTSSQTSAVLGALTDTSLNGETERKQDSDTPDAFISVTDAPGPNADFDGDTDVDGSDFLAWQRGFGLTGPTHAQGDSDGNGTVDGFDLDAWEQQFGGPPLLSAPSVVPEPNSFVLALLGLLFCASYWCTKRLRRVCMVLGCLLTLCWQSLGQAAITIGPVLMDVVQDPTGSPVVLTNPLSDPLALGVIDLAIGNTLGGELFIDSGSDVSNATGTIGRLSGSIGAVFIDGSGSTWANSDQLIVGDNGSGTLSISNGADVVSITGFIGRTASSSGTVSVVGAVANWVNFGDVYVGGGLTSAGNNGNLFIRNGGIVDVNGTIKVWDNEGRVDVTSGRIIAGLLENGNLLEFRDNLNFFTGDLVNDGIVTVGPEFLPQTQQVIFNKVGGTYTNNGTFNVRDGGLIISNGGTFNQAAGNFSGLSRTDLLDGGTLNISGGTFLVEHPGGTGGSSLRLVDNSTLNLTGGQLDMDAVIDLETGQMIQDGGTLNVLNTLSYFNEGIYIYRSGSITGPGTALLNGTVLRLESSDPVSFAFRQIGGFGPSTLIVPSGALSAGQSLDIRDSFAELQLESGATLNLNAGTITLGGDLTTPGGGKLRQNGGTLIGSSGSVKGTHEYVSGSINPTSPNFNVAAGTLDVIGALTFAAGKGLAISGGEVELRNNLTAPGGVTLSGLGKLSGDGTLFGDVSNGGRVAPGFSPEILTIDGDYTQASTGTLEIEIGGLAPGTEHDQLTVTGAATLAGRLEIPLIDTGGGVFMPTAGNSITFLTAASVSGEFDAVVAPNLSAESPGVAIDLTYSAGSVDLAFVAIDTSNLFISPDSSSEWVAGSNWSTAAPGSTNETIIDYQLELPDEPQLVTISASTGDVQVHTLTSSGDTATESMTINVTDGATLAATAGITIGSFSALELGTSGAATGNVAAPTIGVSANAMVTGNGTLGGDVTLNAGATLSPGFSIGSIEVEGDYQQMTGSTLTIEIYAGEFDTLPITGDAGLDGDVEVMLNDITDAPAGSVFQIITAGSVTGTFDNVITNGVDDIFLFPIYGASFAALGSADEGDMDPSVPGLGPEDAAAFAFGLTDPDGYMAMYGFDPIMSGNIDDDGDFDFDDIQPFVNLLNGVLAGGMTMDRMMEIIQAAQNRVPEPTGITLILVGGFLLLPARRPRSCPPRLQGVA